MNRAFALVGQPCLLPSRLALAGALVWTTIFALHTLGGALALQPVRGHSPRIALLIETAPMLVLIVLAALVLVRNWRRTRPIGPSLALAWIILPPVVDSVIWQPMAQEIVLVLGFLSSS